MKKTKIPDSSPLQSRNSWVRLFKFMSALAPLSEYMHRSFERNWTKISGANWLETDIEKSSTLNFHPGRLFSRTSELPSPTILELGTWNSYQPLPHFVATCTEILSLIGQRFTGALSHAYDCKRWKKTKIPDFSPPGGSGSPIWPRNRIPCPKIHRKQVSVQSSIIENFRQIPHLPYWVQVEHPHC